MPGGRAGTRLLQILQLAPVLDRKFLVAAAWIAAHVAATGCWRVDDLGDFDGRQLPAPPVLAVLLQPFDVGASGCLVHGKKVSHKQKGPAI